MPHTPQQVAAMNRLNHARLAPLEDEVEREEESMRLFPHVFGPDREDGALPGDPNPMDNLACKTQGCTNKTHAPYQYCFPCEIDQSDI